MRFQGAGLAAEGFPVPGALFPLGRGVSIIASRSSGPVPRLGIVRGADWVEVLRPVTVGGLPFRTAPGGRVRLISWVIAAAWPVSSHAPGPVC